MNGRSTLSPAVATGCRVGPLWVESGRWLHHVVGPTDRDVSDEVVMSELWLRLAISNAGEDEGLSVCG